MALAWAAQAQAQTTTTFDYTGAAQTFSVGTSGTYVFTVAGASGGNGTSGNANLTGGAGAIIIGSYTLLSGQTLNLIVGGAGGNASGFNGGGGGGGSFVYDITTAQLVAAAGGGGGGGAQSGGASGGQTTTSGAYGAGSGAGPGGDNGAGGTANPNNHGGGGGGFLTAGQNSSFARGGAAYPSSAGGTNSRGASGGFGGGGAASQEGGGGGGYSGGGGGSGVYHYGGGGGGSYEAAGFSLTSATAGSNGGATTLVGNLGNGYITLYLLSALPPPAPPSSAIGGGTFLASGLGGGVLPEFQGGTLRIDLDSQTYGQAFSLGHGANTVDLSGHAVTFSGGFSDAAGPGAIVIANSGAGGRAIFTAANSYTGATTIDAGAALALAGAGAVSRSSAVVDNGVFDVSAVSGPQATIASLAGAGQVNLGAVTLVISGGADTFGGGFSGTGGLTVSGGTQTLSGASTISATTVTGGVLIVTGPLTSVFSIASGGRLQGDATSLRAQGAIADNGTLVFDQAADATFASAVAGSGAIIKQGAGALTLAAAASAASTTVAGGSLILGAPLTSAFTVDSGATLQADASTLLAQGQVTNNGTLVFDQAGAGVFSGAVTGPGGLVKQNTGLLVLDGASSAGQTNVSGGGLQVGDLLHPSAELDSAVMVSSAGTLSGHGQVVGSVTNAGVVSPGGSIGTLTVQGAYAQSPSGTLAIQLDPTASSRLAVSGTATLDGRLDLLAAPGTYRAGTRYAVVTAGTLSGGFAQATLSNGLPFTLSAEDGAEVVTLDAGLFPTAGATRNQAAAGTAFVNVPVGHADFDQVAAALTALPTDPQQQAAAEATGGEIAAQAALQGRAALRGFMGAVSDQLFDESRQGGERGGDRGGAWGRAFGGSGAVRGDGDAHRVSTDQGGLVAGGSRGLGPDTTLGAFVGYRHADVSLQGLPQSGTADAYVLGAYAERRLGVWFVDASAAAGLSEGDSRRTIAFGPIARRAEGGSTGTLLSGSITAGARFHTAAGMTIEPSVSLLATRAAQDGYVEHGAGDIDLAVSRQVDRATQGRLGLRLAKAFALGEGRSLELEGEAAAARDLDARAPTIREAYAVDPADSFILAGAAPGAGGGVFGAGATYRSGRLSLYARYDATPTGASDERQFTAGLRLAW